MFNGIFISLILATASEILKRNDKPHLKLQFGGGTLLLMHVEVLPMLELLLAVRTGHRLRRDPGLGLGSLRRFRFPAFVLFFPVQSNRLSVPAMEILS